MIDTHKVTVAVCSVDRPTLRHGLSNIALDETEMIEEVLVIDNSHDHVLCSANFAVRPDLRLLRIIPGPGSTSGGRNLAIAEAKTDVVLFFDDDCLPQQQWAKKMATYMTSYPSVAAAFGGVDPTPIPGSQVRTDEIPVLGGSAWGEADGAHGRLWCAAVSSPKWCPGIATSTPTVPWAIVGSSNNMAIRRSLMLPGRPVFLPELGPGTGAGSGEDTEFGFALMAAGRDVAHVPEARLYHDSWLTPSQTHWVKRCYFRGTVEALGYHALRGDSRASELLVAYLSYFHATNQFGLADFGEVLEWAYGDLSPGKRRLPLRKSDLKPIHTELEQDEWKQCHEE